MTALRGGAADAIALIALRDPGEGKTRLAPALSVARRAEVTRAMACDVVAALRAAGIPRIVLVARGTLAERFGESLGLPVLRDRSPRSDLSTALADGLRALGTSPTVLLVCADLPGLQAADVHRLLTAPADLAVAPTRDGGTGGLLLRAGRRIDLAYGPRSAAVHQSRGAAAGLSVTTVASGGFGHDVDEPVHLEEAVGRWPTSHTARTVSGWSVLTRRPTR